ncbi:MAG TPA: DUF3597 domain-containing protein [Anaerolineales bacterium]|nr:DUF3597 domain-containing protein [Anaerolineales bacterium]
MSSFGHNLFTLVATAFYFLPLPPFIKKGPAMSLFDKILEKLGLKDTTPAKTATKPPQVRPGPGVRTPAPGIKDIRPPRLKAVDVAGKLDALAAKNPQKLNWKVSIVDLLKLLGIDSSYEARKELAVELGCPPDKMGDSAAMNTWLHKTVLQKMADNGGNVPRELLD